MELLLFLGTLFLFMSLGIPLALVLVICAIVLMGHSGMWDTMIIPTSMLDGANNYPLMLWPWPSSWWAASAAVLATQPLWPPSSLQASWDRRWARQQPWAACCSP